MAGAPEQSKHENLASGAIIDSKFEILSLLAQGATSEVYRAKHLVLGSELAVKVLSENLAESEQALNRFHAEAKLSSKLNHPHLVKIVSYGVLKDGRPYLAMELLSGKTLAEVIECEGVFHSRKVATLIEQLGSALEAMHSNGLVHRDLKPENIMILELEPLLAKIIDFGLVKDLESNQKITKTGQLLGSAAYMSPEQCLGKSADSRSDIYSLACVAYFCLMGRPPFLGENELAIMNNQVNQSPTPPVVDQDHEMAGFEGIILRCLRKIPEERYQSISDLKMDIQRCLDGELSARFSQPPAGQSKGRSFNAIVVGSFIFLLAALVMSFSLMSKTRTAVDDKSIATDKSRSLIGASKHKEQARRLARDPNLLDGRRVRTYLKDPDTILDYYQQWLKINTNASLEDRMNAELELHYIADELSKFDLSKSSADIAERYLKKLLADTKGDDTASVILRMQHANKLAAIASWRRDYDQLLKYQLYRREQSKKVETDIGGGGSDEEMAIFNDLVKAYSFTKDYVGEEKLMNEFRLWPDAMPACKYVSTDPKVIAEFVQAPAAAETKMSFLEAFERNQRNLKKNKEVAQIRQFLVKVAAAFPAAFDRTNSFAGLARFEQELKGPEVLNYALRALDESRTCDSSVDVRNIQVLVISQIIGCYEDKRQYLKAAPYFERLASMIGDEGIEFQIMQMLKGYQNLAIRTKNTVLCERIAHQANSVAARHPNDTRFRLIYYILQLKYLKSKNDKNRPAMDEIADKSLALQPYMEDKTSYFGLLQEIAGEFRLDTNLIQAERIMKHIINSVQTERGDSAQENEAKLYLALLLTDQRKFQESLDIIHACNLKRLPVMPMNYFLLCRAQAGLDDSTALNKPKEALQFIADGERIIAEERIYNNAFAISETDFYTKFGPLAQAERLARHSLEYQKREFPENHNDLALAYVRLAKTLQPAKRREALSYLSEAQRLVKTQSDDPRFVPSLLSAIDSAHQEIEIK